MIGVIESFKEYLKEKNIVVVSHPSLDRQVYGMRIVKGYSDRFISLKLKQCLDSFRRSNPGYILSYNSDIHIMYLYPVYKKVDLPDGYVTVI